jgi:sugar O-acyltransferase (sialic acid O-acetyltransferase NeuD family)
MEDLILYGSGGMAREVVELVADINAVRPTWRILGYIDDVKGDSSEYVNGFPLLGTWEMLRDVSGRPNVIIAVSNPSDKEAIFRRIRDFDIRFPTLIHPSAKVARNAQIGQGSIIGIDCIVSTDVRIGDHVFLNMRTIVGHDSVIMDFSSCLVGCIIAGGVVVKDSALLGSGCIIMEKTTIGCKSKVSMGSVVSFDVEDHHVVMSRPSKSMYFGE